MSEDYEEGVQAAVWDMFIKCKDDYSVSREIVNCLHEAHDSIWRLRERLELSRQKANDAHSVLASESMAWLSIGSLHRNHHREAVMSAVRRYWSKYGNFFKPGGFDISDEPTARVSDSWEESVSDFCHAALIEVGNLNKIIHDLRQVAMEMHGYADHDEDCISVTHGKDESKCSCGYSRVYDLYDGTFFIFRNEG